jgi:hypothetical protein
LGATLPSFTTIVKVFAKRKREKNPIITDVLLSFAAFLGAIEKANSKPWWGVEIKQYDRDSTR